MVQNPSLKPARLDGGPARAVQAGRIGDAANRWIFSERSLVSRRVTLETSGTEARAPNDRPQRELRVRCRAPACHWQSSPAALRPPELSCK